MMENPYSMEFLVERGRKIKERRKKERKKNKPLNRNKKKKIHLKDLNFLAMNVNGIGSPEKSDLAEIAVLNSHHLTQK